MSVPLLGCQGRRQDRRKNPTTGDPGRERLTAGEDVILTTAAVLPLFHYFLLA